MYASNKIQTKELRKCMRAFMIALPRRRMSSSSCSLDENLANVGQPRRPGPCISANQEHMAGGEPGLVLPTSREIQEAWEEVVGSEEELEAEEGPVAVQEPELEE